jgi:hypothetical protein
VQELKAAYFQQKGKIPRGKLAKNESWLRTRLSDHSDDVPAARPSPGEPAVA